MSGSLVKGESFIAGIYSRSSFVSTLSYCSRRASAFARSVGQTQFFQSKTSFEKNCFSAWASTLNMGLINKVDMVCLSPVGYGV